MSMSTSTSNPGTRQDLQACPALPALSRSSSIEEVVSLSHPSAGGQEYSYELGVPSSPVVLINTPSFLSGGLTYEEGSKRAESLKPAVIAQFGRLKLSFSLARLYLLGLFPQADLILLNQAIVLSANASSSLRLPPSETVIRRHVSLLTADASAQTEIDLDWTCTQDLCAGNLASSASSFLFLISLVPEEIRAPRSSPPRSAILRTYIRFRRTAAVGSGACARQIPGRGDGKPLSGLSAQS
jgi:hypothetical protein